MKNIIYLRPLCETETSGLTYLDYSIVYYDQVGSNLKLVVPDYNGEFVDNADIYKAVNTNISFFRHVNIFNEENGPVISMLIDDGEIKDVYGSTIDEIKNSLNTSGQVLRKRLK